MDPGIREREGGVCTEREAVGLVDVQLAVGGIAKQLHGSESDGQIDRLEDVQHRVVRMLVAGRRRGTPRQGDGTDGAGALKVEEVGGEGLVERS